MKFLIALCIAVSSPCAFAVFASDGLFVLDPPRPAGAGACAARLVPDLGAAGLVLADGLYRGFAALSSWTEDFPQAAGEFEIRVDRSVDPRRALVIVATPRGSVGAMVDLEHTVLIREHNKLLLYGTTLGGATQGALLLFSEAAVAAGDLDQALAQFAAAKAPVSRL